jgi:hypothetical protein
MKFWKKFHSLKSKDDHADVYCDPVFQDNGDPGTPLCSARDDWLLVLFDFGS